MLLPLWMLHNLQIQTIQKLGLACLFLLAMIDILFDILRTTHRISGIYGQAVAATWDILEPTIAVIISCLPSYRALFKLSRSEPLVQYNTLHYNAKATTTHAKRDAYRFRSDIAGFELRSSVSSSQ